MADDVREIVAAVRARGDAALLEYVERFDGVAGTAAGRRRRAGRGARALDPAVRAGLEVAIANVRAVAEAGLGRRREVELPQGQRVTMRELPVRRAAIYVPGGAQPVPVDGRDGRRHRAGRRRRRGRRLRARRRTP